MITIPGGFRDSAARAFGPAGVEWCERLPAMVDEYLQSWNLTLDFADGPEPWYGFCAIVVPVRTSTDDLAVLKISWADEETAHEHTALATWAGRSAVRLLKADGPRRVLLLERLDAHRDLRALPIDEAADILAALLAELAVPGPPEIDKVADLAARWSDELPGRWQAAGRPCDERLLAAAVDVCRELGQSQGSLMIHSDLHYENVLASVIDTGDGAWLAIDPKPMIGDVEFGVLPAMWNRLEDLDPARPDQDLRRRLRRFTEVAGIDHERARAWSMARAVETVVWNAEIDLVQEVHEPAWVARTFATPSR